MLEQGSRYSAAAVPDEDEAADWYQQACVALDAAGVEQYEISNFARPGHRSRHNLKYWKRQPYVGFGLDAHSMLPAEAGDMRFANTSDLEEYLGHAKKESAFPLLKSARGPGLVEVDVIVGGEAFEEALFLGLRLNEGVAFSGLRTQFGEGLLEDAMPALMEVRDAGLLEWDAEKMWLTPQGRLASNEVFSRVLIPALA
jgi:oxygen-independent coproporphyrinogen III oxidase